MGRIAAICCVCIALISAALLGPPNVPVPEVGAMPAYAQATGTELMQQSDHHRRVERAKKAEAESEEEQMAAFGIPEAPGRDYDYLVLILLAVSVVILSLVARRDRRASSRL
jgi:hypothetical protein